MTDIDIRPAGLADADSLVPLLDGYRQFYGRNSDPAAAHDFLRARLAHGESVVFIAVAGGRAVGFTQLYPSFSSVSLARTFILNDLYVEPAWRKQGIAKRLISAAMEYAAAQGALRLTLSTAEDNGSAQALYESMGWKRDTQFRVYHFQINK